MAEDGKFLGMNVDLMEYGAYLGTFGPYIPYGGAEVSPVYFPLPGHRVHQHLAG